MAENNYDIYLKTDVSKYIGEWIAICDGKLVSHGKKVKEILKQANSLFPGKKVLIARVPEKETMIFYLT